MPEHIFIELTNFTNTVVVIIFRVKLNKIEQMQLKEAILTAIETENDQGKVDIEYATKHLNCIYVNICKKDINKCHNAQSLVHYFSIIVMLVRTQSEKPIFT